MDAAQPTGPERVNQPPAPLAAWPRSAQITLACLIGLAIVLLAAQGYSRSRWAARPSVLEPQTRLDYRIDLNQADRAQLLQLPGVGDSLVGRIEEYRRDHGRFGSIEELAQVRGIGPTTLERLRSWVFVNANEADNRLVAATEQRSQTGVGQRKKPLAGKSASSKEAGLSGAVDINHASAEELQRLPGIGPKMAERILEERRKLPFRTVDDLRRVHGIGPKTLERLRPHVTVDPEPTAIVNARPS